MTLYLTKLSVKRISMNNELNEKDDSKQEEHPLSKLEALKKENDASKADRQTELTRRIFIEAPSGERFEADVNLDVKLNILAADFFAAQGWPTQDRRGRSQRAVVEIVNSENTSETKRIDGDLTVAKASLKDGDLLRIFPESIAGCFLGNVKITLEHGGTKPISEIKVDDTLISGMPNSTQLSVAKVIRIFKDTSRTCLTINGTLNITDTHPVCSNGYWIEASQLVVGDHLQSISGEKILIESIQQQHGDFEVYNLYVSSIEHTFFAEGLLVHNMAFKEMTAREINSSINIGNELMKTNNDVLSIRISLATAITLNEFFDSITDRMQAIDFIYSIFSLLVSNDYGTINNFIKTIKQQETQIPSNTYLHSFMTIANVEPLRIQSIHYGSPVTIDLLGIGSVLEIVRDTIKDLAWRSQHEKAMAELELKAKHSEIQKNKLDVETMSVSRKLDIEKAALELQAQRVLIEKANTELLSQKIELLNKITNLQLSDDDRKVVVSVLLPKALTITNNPVTPLSKNIDPYHILFNRKD